MVEFVGHPQTLAGLADTICVTYSGQLLLVDSSRASGVCSSALWAWP
jgi:hypothetical protein